MIFNHGYAHKSKQVARERIERLKEQNHQEIVIRKQKIKELSKQTNELRKRIKDKSKTLQDEEEERRATILENRKLKQQIATEKFQRIQDKRLAKGKKTGPKNGLKNGIYHVRGHVIEIQDGIRVNSRRQDEPNEEIEQPPIQYNSYTADSYLTTHLNKLNNEGITIEKVDNSCEVDEIEVNYYNNTLNERNNVDSKPMLSQVMSDLQYDGQLAQTKIKNTSARDDDSVCSTDSLEDSGEEQKMLKSSLKMSKDGLSDSLNRKVTFSDSIEFNDGKTGRLHINALERVPLFERLEKNAMEGERPKPHITAYTAEEVLDQLREEALMTKFSETNDIRYPTSIVAAMEQLSKRNEKEEVRVDIDEPKTLVEELQKSTKSGNESLENSYDNPNISKNENKLSSVVGEPVVMEISDANENDQEVYEYIPDESDSHAVNNNVIKNEIENNKRNVITPNYNTNYIMPVSSSYIHATATPISHYDQTNRKSEYPYSAVTIPTGLKSENPSDLLSPCLSIGQYDTSALQTESSNGDVPNPQQTYGHAYKPPYQTYGLPTKTSNGYASNPQQTCGHGNKPPHQTYGVASNQTNDEAPNSHQTDDKSDEEPSGVLYVPQYPIFPSKDHRYNKNTTYDGRQTLNYYQSQYKNDYLSNIYNDKPTSSPAMTSVVTSNVNSYSSYNSKPSTGYASRRVDAEPDNNTKSKTQGVTKELSVSYINITSRDVQKSDSELNADDVYKDVERTLAGITFGKSLKDERHYLNSNFTDVVKTHPKSNIGGLSQEESKISNDSKSGMPTPVRIHQNAKDVTPVRRGRVIVSADSKKRRQIGNMVPSPPAKPKVNSNMEENNKLTVPTANKNISKEKGLVKRNYSPSNKNEQDKKPDKQHEKKKYYSDQEINRNYNNINNVSTVDNQTDFNNN